MNIGTFLQAVISIVFIYLILSLLTSELQEYLATFSEARAKRLKQSIRQMLGEEDWLDGNFIDGKDIKTYSQNNDAIPEKSMVWLNDKKEPITTPKVAFDENDNSLKFIWIDTKNNNEDFTEGEVIVVSSSEPEKAAKRSDANLTRFEVYQVAADITSSSDFCAWEKDGKLTPVEPGNAAGEVFPVYKSANKTTIKAGAKAWKQVQNITEVLGIIQTFTINDGVNNQEFVWIDTNNNNQQIDSPEVVSDSPASEKGAKINSSLKKYPLYQVFLELKKDTKYYINTKNQRILPPNSLTEELYKHPNIQALNQSAFRWFWILGISFNYPWKDFKTLESLNIFDEKFWEDFNAEDIFNLISTALLIISVSCLFFSQILFPFILLPFAILRIVGLLSFIKDKDKKGKVGSRRESLGPSYIDDSKLFAKTLIDVIYGSSSNIDDKNSNDGLKKSVNSLKFYTPASSRLVKRLEKSADITNLETFTSDLQNQYDEVQKRSAGVYKRNAKGLSFVVGLLIAISFNADTFNMISNLTDGSNKFGEQLISQLGKNPDLFKDKTKQTELKEFFNNSTSLPLGWDYDDKLRLQQAKEEGSKNQEEIGSLRTLITTLKGDNDDIRTLCKDKKRKTDCFEKVENLLLDGKNSAIIPNLDDDFKNKFKEVQKKDKDDEKSGKLSSFVDSYNNFLETKEEKLKTLVLDTSKEDVNTTPITSLTETLKNGKVIVEQKQGGWLKVSIGWLITAIALSMGAPFWFDLLGKVMNVRNAAKPEAAKPEEPENSQK